MQIARKVCAVVPVKDARHAKARLAGVLSGAQRTQLAHAMLEDVLIALAATAADLDSILVVTVDRRAADIAVRYGAEPTAEHADAGHTAAVRAAAQRLESCGVDLLTLPADIPLVQPEDIGRLLVIHDEAAKRGGRLFGIAPARDGRGSNAIVCSPASAVPLQFGDDSFAAHLAAARACGIEPSIAHLPRVALDIDRPDDLASLLAIEAHTRTHALLRRWRHAGHDALCALDASLRSDQSALYSRSS